MAGQRIMESDYRSTANLVRQTKAAGLSNIGTVKTFIARRY